jgi:hypothetical protein
MPSRAQEYCYFRDRSPAVGNIADGKSAYPAGSSATRPYTRKSGGEARSVQQQQPIPGIQGPPAQLLKHLNNYYRYYFAAFI